MKFGFVVLHYMAYEMTIQCINELLVNFVDNNITIVVVDNGSGNNSGKLIYEYYKGNSIVKVLLNESNLGFAKGNNIGYEYLVNNTNCDFIIILNNDVLIQQKNILLLIEEIYSNNNFAVLGPDIINPYALRKHQNPFFLKAPSINQIRKTQLKFKIELKFYCLYYIYKFLLQSIKRNKLLLSIYYYFKYSLLKKTRIDYSEEYVNPILHGACYILSPIFLTNREQAFNPETFLYFEENILYHECIKNNLLMLYSPVINVIHLEDVSTNMIFNSEYRKEFFKIKEMLKSIETLIRVMEN